MKSTSIQKYLVIERRIAMRNLFLLRGCPGSGKSTFIKENHLEPYTLCADQIRLLYQSPVLLRDGKLGISMSHENRVWDRLKDILEERMMRGECIIIDATHYKAELLNAYKDIYSKYRYRVYIIDFTDIPLETILERNRTREGYKFVPEDKIQYMYDFIHNEENIVSKRYTVISREQALEMFNGSIKYDWTDDYEKIIAFGDIHGCYEPIKTYFDKYGINDNYAYVFTGDYIDRGIQNKEVVEFLISMKDRKNFIFLEGNHEKWLRLYSEDNVRTEPPTEEEAAVLKKYLKDTRYRAIMNNTIKSGVFLEKTAKEIESIDKKDIRRFCNRLSQIVYVKFGEKDVLITHGGLPTIPNIFTQTMQIINGVGGYEDTEQIYDVWQSHDYAESTIFVHAHRNSFDYPINPREGIYNICSAIEYGKPLRIVEISKDGTVSPIEIENPVYSDNLPPHIHQSTFVYTKGDNEILKDLNSQKNVIKKFCKNGIISYNFSKDVFKKKEWDDVTCRARGLFVDYLSEKVVCRSYDKFFNWGERPETEEEALKQNLKFPCNVYLKYNGFLALVSYDTKNDDFLICSKSSTDSYHVDIIKTVMDEIGVDKDALKQIVKTYDFTLVFECCDSIRDPHIIKYDRPHLYLLDLINNGFNTIRIGSGKHYANSMFIASQVKGIEYKANVATFHSFDDIIEFMGKTIENLDWAEEGVVIEDANGFMVKLKSTYYRLWKYVREHLTYVQNLRTINDNLSLKTMNQKDHMDPRVVEECKSIDDFLINLAKEGKVKDLNSVLDLQDLYNEYKKK